MLEVINDTVRCMELPYAIASIVLIASFAKKWKWVVIFVLSLFAMFLWRRFIVVYSTRYSSIFLILFFVLLAFFLKNKTLSNSRILKTIVILSIISLIGSDIIKYNLTFHNNYILCAQDFVTRSLKNDPDAIALIHPKEINRIGESHKRADTYYTSFPSTVKKYSAWGGAVYVVHAESKKKPDSSPDSSGKLKKVCSFIKDNSRKSFLSVYRYDAFLPLFEKGSISSDVSSNCITNGDIEILEDSDNQKKKLKYLTSRGLKFYDSETIKIPQYETMLITWGEIDPVPYPEVTVEEKTPLDGKYSLDIKFMDEVRYGVYLFNKIPSKPGTLRFIVKRTGGDGVIYLKRLYYCSRGLISAPEMYYIISPPDQEIRTVELPLSVDIPDSESSILCIFGSNIHFLIDDISFTCDAASI